MLRECPDTSMIRSVRISEAHSLGLACSVSLTTADTHGAAIDNYFGVEVSETPTYFFIGTMS